MSLQIVYEILARAAAGRFHLHEPVTACRRNEKVSGDTDSEGLIEIFDDESNFLEHAFHGQDKLSPRAVQQTGPHIVRDRLCRRHFGDQVSTLLFYRFFELGERSAGGEFGVRQQLFVQRFCSTDSPKCSWNMFRECS
ncbi:MAG: hypothetical protein A2W29_13390 [Gemmatimonadetes bacterium RBG_16_66_8]|nr:MAG: hypothetical protein A2W29_13390 [Gemmatimonadetes bacterium RBG_16_66_8]